MSNPRIDHRLEVISLAQIIDDKRTNNKPLYAIDVNKWGVSAPFSDPENLTMYRETLTELIEDTFFDEDAEQEPHYPNASYESIHDY